MSKDPLKEFLEWFQFARDKKVSFADAMTLATTTKKGRPSARIVLYKGYLKREKAICFFTNYDSAKGEELKKNPYAALVFHWADLERQIRIEGKVKKMSAKDSDEYWASRPRGSQISGFVSNQSKEIKSREVLEQKVKVVENVFKGKPIPRPKNWGGYFVVPDRYEFWQGRANRLHDRILFVKKPGGWKHSLLSP